MIKIYALGTYISNPVISILKFLEEDWVWHLRKRVDQQPQPKVAQDAPLQQQTVRLHIVRQALYSAHPVDVAHESPPGCASPPVRGMWESVQHQRPPQRAYEVPHWRKDGLSLQWVQCTVLWSLRSQGELGSYLHCIYIKKPCIGTKESFIFP